MALNRNKTSPFQSPILVEFSYIGKGEYEVQGKSYMEFRIVSKYVIP